MNALDYPIMSVLNDAIDATLSGTGGALAIPAGGKVSVAKVAKSGAYRLTFDVVVLPPERRLEPEGWGARRIIEFEKAHGS